MKKILAYMLAFISLFTGSAALAASSDFPHAFWSLDEKYNAANNSHDYNNVIWYGKQEIEMCSSMIEGESKRNVLTSRYDEVGKAYFALGDYDNAAEIYATLYDYEKNLGAEYAERAKIARMKARQYASEMSIYTDSGEYTYYGAKNEKQNGVLFGVCSDGATRSKMKNESMTIVYQELGQSFLPHNTNMLKQASEKGIAVELALNCPKEGQNISNITSYDSYLEEISAKLKKYDNIPVYLRFAAEFDIWGNMADSESYKSAFRHVSDYFKKRNSNVAMVWSPNQASRWDIDIDDYYPGDEYVDWVGVSSYAKPYPDVTSGDPADQALFFKNGINSEPVTALRDIIEKYGSRKPIMLSESGAGHCVMNNDREGEDTTAFALKRLREYYTYLPMVYPQIKLIAYFDNYVSGNGEKNDFRLSTSSELQDEYLKLTKGARFIQGSYSNDASFCYRKIENGRHLNSAFLLSCYAHRYGCDTKSVEYYIDDKKVGQSSKMPFEIYVDGREYAGRHRIKAVAHFTDGEVMERGYDVDISDNGGDISVEISGGKVDFDQTPVVYNDRTMVPMRKIFEELNAEVSWDAATQTATGKRGDRTVKIAIGDNKMYINHKEVTLDTAPMILGDRTLVPVRAVAEGMGCEVGWDGPKRIVEITPRVFTWSDWSTDLPADVNQDLFYIEHRSEYRTHTRTREKENYTLSHKSSFGNYIKTEKKYGKWSDWYDFYIDENEYREVQTRTVSEPDRYLYYHYCTGHEDTPSLSYQTSSENFSDKATYHELSAEHELPDAPDGRGGKVLYVNSEEIFECSNGCFRWYLNGNGRNETQYRSRSVDYLYYYWRWGDWSEWSKWSDWKDGEFDTNLRYSLPDNEDIDAETRMLYRYKEK